MHTQVANLRTVLKIRYSRIPRTRWYTQMFERVRMSSYDWVDAIAFCFASGETGET